MSFVRRNGNVKEKQKLEREALEGATRELVKGILGEHTDGASSTVLTVETCKAALHQYQLMEEETYMLTEELKTAKAQKIRAVSAQAARVQTEAAEKRWTIKKLENDVSTRDKRINELEKRVIELNQQVAANSRLNDQAEKKATIAKQKVDELESCNAELKKQLEEMEKHMAADARAQADRFQKEAAQAQQKIAELERDVELQESLNTDLEKQVKELEEKESATANLQAELASAVRAQKRVGKLERDVDLQKKKNEELASLVKELEEQNAENSDRFHAEATQARRTIAELEGDLDRQESINAELEKRIHELEDSNVMHAGESAARLQSEAANAEWTIAKLESDIRLQEKRNAKLQNQVKELQEKNVAHANAHAKCLEFENWMRELRDKSMTPDERHDVEKTILLRRLEVSRKELLDARQANTALATELEATGHDSSRLVLDADDVVELESLVQQRLRETQKLVHELEECRGQLSSAEMDIEFLTKKLSQSRETADSIAEMENLVKQKDTENVQLRNKLDASESVIEYLTTKLVDSRDLERKVHELENVVQQKSIEIQRLDAQRATAESRLPRDLADEAKRLQEELEDYRNQLLNANAEIEILSTKLVEERRLAQKIVELEDEVQEKVEENERVESQLEEYRMLLAAKVSEMESNTTEVERIIRELESASREKDGEVVRLNCELKECRDQLSLAESEITSLTKKLEETRIKADKVPELENLVAQRVAEKQRVDALLEECRGKLSKAAAENESLVASLLATRVSLAKSNSRQNSFRFSDTSSVVSHDSRKVARSGKGQKASEESPLHLELEVERLNDLIEDMGGQLSFTDEKNASLLLQLSEAQRKLKHAQERANYLESQNFYFNDEEQDFASQPNLMVSSLQEEVSEARAAAKRSYEEVLELRITIKEKDGEISSLKKKLEKEILMSETMHSEVNDFGTQLFEAESEKASLQQELSLAKDSLKKSSERIAVLESDVTRLRQAEERLVGANTMIDSLQQELVEVAARTSEMEERLEKVTELEAKIKCLESEKEELRDELDELQQQLSDSLTENTRLAENSVGFEKKLIEAREKTQRLDRQIAMLHQVEEKSAILEREVAMLKEAEQLAAEEFAAVAAQKKEHAAAKARAEQADLLIEEFADLEDRLQQELLENENLHQMLNEYRNKLFDSENKAAALQREIENSAAKDSRALNEGRGAESNKDILISSLRQEVEAAKTRADKAQMQASKLEAMRGLGSVEQDKMLRQLDLENQRLRDEVADLEVQLTEARTSAEELKQELKYSHAKLSELSCIVSIRDSNGMEEVLKVKCEKLAKVAVERDLLREELKTTRAKSQTLLQECELKTELVGQLSSSWDAAASVNENVKRLQADYDRSLRRATDLSVQLANSQMKIDELTDELKKARLGSSAHASTAVFGPSKSDLTDYWSQSNAKSTREVFAGAANDLSTMFSRKFASSHGP